MKIKANPEKVRDLLQGIYEVERYPLIKNGELVLNTAGKPIFIDNKLGPKAIYAHMRTRDALVPINNAFANTFKALDDKYAFILSNKPLPADDASDEFKAAYDKEVEEIRAAHQAEVNEILATEEEIDLHCYSVHQLNLTDPLNRISSNALNMCRELFTDIEELENL